MSAFRSWWNQRSLTGKQSVILLLSTVLFVPFIYLALSSLLSPTFAGIESRAVADQEARAKNALVAYEKSLQNDVGDYAVWDSSFDYLTNPDKDFETETLTPLAYQNMGVDVIAYVRFDGTVIWSDVVDRVKGVSLPAESKLFSNFVSKGAFFDSARGKNTHIEYQRTGRGLYVVYSQWVVRSDGAGKPAGMIVMGNLLDAATLSEALQVKVDLNLAVRAADAALLKAAPGKVTSLVAPDQITTRLGLEDQRGKLLGTVDFGTPRDTTAAGHKGILLATVAMIASMIALVGVLAWSNRSISGHRLKALEGYVRTMRSEDAPLPEAMTLGGDEIASLARQFTALGQELDSAEEELRKSAYLQGKADSAAGMLHNVRNALVPIRVMQEKWLAEETMPFRLNLARAAAELDAEGVAPDRRQQLIDFIVSAARKIALTSEGRRLEMEETKSSIDQIAAILTSYNFDTSGTSAPDSIDVIKLLKQEVAVVNAASASPVRFDLPVEIPVLLGNRVHFSQVLANVLVNASEAMEAAGVPEKAIAITISDATDGMVAVHMRDNGDGIGADKLAAVFQRGYSTRAHKSGGLGMHWSANVMRAMDGTISISSEGPGKGATVTLSLRRKSAESAPKALAA
jgi:two-component system, OmpR family, sensor kinase